MTLEGRARQASCVMANILRPSLDQGLETLPIAGEQRPRRVLEARFVSSHGNHEPVRCLPRLAHAVLAAMRASCVLDELAQGDGGSTRLSAQPVPMKRQQGHLARDDAELSEWCAARWLGAWKPLRPLPATFAETRLALHRVGELVASPARRAGTGNEISLRYTRGGFGTPFYADDMQVRVEGTDLVVAEGAGERRAEIESVRQAAEFVGTIESADLDPAPLAIDGESASVLGDWFGFATIVLAELRARAGGGLDASAINLWAEHFDVAVELGSEETGQRAAYGGSPGDEDHADPYLYVGPWGEVPKGDLWNATHFGGALLPYDVLLASGDQVALALDFFEDCVVQLTSG